MDGGSWHLTGDRDQDHTHGKEMQRSKMAVWGGLTNTCERREVKAKSPYLYIYVHSSIIHNSQM